MVRAAAAVRSRLDRSAAEVLGLALVAYVPFLLSSPGQVAVDSKQYLYLDPSRFLAKAAYLWDHTVAAGTVTHQHIGFLWPMGPWFWLAEVVGLPDWLAQRLWMGTLTFLAALGARWLLRHLGVGRTGAVVGAVVYALSPYQLAYVARFSDLLLPWAGLPWIVELTRRAVRYGGWRHPALIALVVLSVSGINASSVLLVAPGPASVLVAHAIRGRGPARAALAVAGRVTALALPACAWWIAGLRLQAAYALPVLQITERLETVAAASSPDDVLRGIGNWIFYGTDRLGYSIDQAEAYLVDRPLRFATFAVPVVIVLGGVALRWRHRAVAVALVVCGMVLSVGAWPYHDPSLYGRAFRAFAEQTSAGLAFRNSPRAVPLLLLGFAVLAGGTVTAIVRPRLRRSAAVLLVLLVVASLGPVWTTGYTSDGLERPEELPRHWVEAIADLDAGDHDTRVLEVPGINFTAYRWGNTVEPITPGLTDRPHIAREVLPYGSAASATLLEAVDRRIQQGIVEPSSVAPMARLLGVGDIVVRNDMQWERFGLMDSVVLWNALVDAPDLAAPRTYGPDAPRSADEHLAPLDPFDLAGTTSDRPPSVGIFEVRDPRPIVRVAGEDGPVVVGGDADGLVDAAGAGLIDGRALVLLSGSLDDGSLTRALDAGADLVLTDTNRRRIQTWFYTLRGTRGPTERAGETLVEPSGYDARLDPLAEGGDDARSVVRHLGGTATATSGGGAERPAGRAIAAIDGDVHTAWEVITPHPEGSRWTVELDEAVPVDRVALVQTQQADPARRIAAVRLHVGDAPPVEVALDERSWGPDGQEVEVPGQEADRLAIEILAVTGELPPPGEIQPVGFAEVRLGGAQLAETVRLPVDLLGRAGERADDHALDVLLTRLRSHPADVARRDEEPAIDRTVELPSTRAFGLEGTARVSPAASDEVLDQLLRPGGEVRVAASSRLPGHLGARASSAFDGDADTAWVAAPGSQVGQWIEVTVDEPIRVDQVRLDVVADGSHSVPTQVRIVVDGEDLGRYRLPDVTDGSELGETSSIVLPLDRPAEGRTIRVVVDEVRRHASPPDDQRDPATLPVGIAEIELGDLRVAPETDAFDGGCRDDLLALDGRPLPVRITGDRRDARSGLRVTACGDVELAAGERRIVARPGRETGIDLDRLTLSSAPGGAPGAVGVRGATTTSAAEIRTVDTDRVVVRSSVESDGTPFWLVLGQSANDGWAIEVDGGTAGPRTLVDGFANGWMITPDGPGTIGIEVQWRPQRLIWAALGVSALAVLACLAILAVSRPVAPDSGTSHPRPRLRRPFGDRADAAGGLAPAIAAAVGTAALVGVVSDPLIGALCGLAAGSLVVWPPAWWLLVAAVPSAMVVARSTERPSLAWVVVGLLVADAVSRAAAERRRRGAPGARPG